MDRYDIVIGSKRMGFQERSPIRIAGSALYLYCVRTLLDLPFGDYSIGAKAYRREIVIRHLDCVAGGSSYVLDIIYKSSSDGARITEIPVRCSDMRKSHFSLIHEGVYRLYRLFGVWRRKE